ncbi:virion morphogenesis protein [Camelimonas fluminis]|uniref:Phage virion morphogenesis protein n=1 Tax=Camelimonas fluminis TaxID=1576911 RepID=A0ABV7UG41_9HYPH|nr:phage virion morphogenesis protein [Camelimonas fluminis]GHE72285.1 virion morphogenesis protein [Camelimonas fluminis]
MSGVTIKVNLAGFESVDAALARLNPLQTGTLLEALARLIREQTVDRLIAGGPAPNGSAWKPNLEGRTPILHRSGALARSIDYTVSGSQAIIGSGLIYARIHQQGGKITAKNGKALKFWWQSGGHVNFAVVKSVTMPARPYLGLSASDRAELIAAAVGHIRRLFG